jgi:hypothetical protein
VGEAGAEENRRPGRLLLYEHRAFATVAPGLLSALAAAPVALPPAAVRPRPQRLLIARRWSLESLGLKPGDVLTLQACADDFDDVTIGKPPGRSHEVEIRIVSTNDLLARLEKDQAQVQKELANLHKLQKDALDKVLEVEQRWRNTGRLRPEDVRQVVEAEQLQEQIRSRVGSKDEEGLRAEVRRTLDAMRDNKLPRSGGQQRMEMVAAELKRLAEQELEQIEPRLTEARKQNEDNAQARKPAKGEKGALGEARQHQEEVENTLNELLARLPSLSELTDVQAEAKALRDEQQRLNERVEGLKERTAGTRPDALTPEQRAELAQVADAQAELQKRLDQLLKRMEGSAQEKARESRDRVQHARQQIDQARDNADDPETRRLLDDAAKALDRANRDIEQQKQKQLDQARENLGRAQDDKLNEEAKRKALQEAADALKEAARLAQDKQEQLRRAEVQVRRAQEKSAQDQATAEKLEEAAKALQEAAEREEQAQPLERAASIGRSGQVTDQMKDAAQKIREAKPGQASDQQKKAADTLHKLVKELDEQRQLELDELSKKLKEADDKMTELTRRQEELQKQIQKARQIADPQKRAEELRKLQPKQEQLRKETQDLLRELSRLRANRAAQALGQAAGQMEQQARQLERGEAPDEPQQEDTLDRLNEAQDHLDQARQQADEELAREKLAKIAELLQRLKERHDGMIAERERIQREVLQRKGWTRGLLSSLGGLAESQKDLGREVKGVSEEKLKGAEVFARMLQRSAKAMDRTADALDAQKRKFVDGNAGEADRMRVDEGAVKLQEEARRRLEQVLEALKPDKGGLGRQTKQGGGGGQPNGGQNGAPSDGIPPLAQLKLLRNLQQDVNQRTEAFSKQHPDPKKLTEQEKEELKDLSREQQEVADLLEKLTSAEEPEGDKP